MAPLRLYAWVRDLHLYAGLFLTPFVAVFAISVPAINHASHSPAPELRREAADVSVPAGVESLAGRDRIERLRPLLEQLGVKGEVGFIRFLPREGRLVIPVATPRREILVDVDVRQKTARVSSRDAGLLAASAYLHKSPGPHLADIRGNWAWMRVWSALADATIYLILLTTTTGIWLWLALRAGRRSGLAWLSAGIATFVGVLYALSF